MLTFMVRSDLFSYSSGVYSPSKSAHVVAGHAVSVVGWGVDRGVPYWLCQNSWGAAWGEQGFFWIVWGADACGIESSSGLVLARPLVKQRCSASNCFYLATTRSDCTCQCPFGRTGPKCNKCALNCRNGASMVGSCTKCECKLGFWGRECEGGYHLSSLASCAGGRVWVGVSTRPNQRVGGPWCCPGGQASWTAVLRVGGRACENACVLAFGGSGRPAGCGRPAAV